MVQQVEEGTRKNARDPTTFKKDKKHIIFVLVPESPKLLLFSVSSVPPPVTPPIKCFAGVGSGTSNRNNQMQRRSNDSIHGCQRTEPGGCTEHAQKLHACTNRVSAENNNPSFVQFVAYNVRVFARMSGTIF